MKNEMITYRSDDSERLLVDASQKALEELGFYNGNSMVNTSYELLTALSDAVKRSNLILVLITKSEYIRIKKIVSKSLGIELVRNSTVSKKLGRLADDKEFQLHDHFPKGSVVLESKDCLYSGFYLKSGNQSIVFSPIDTARTEGILEKAGIKLNIECTVSCRLRFIGITQPQLEKSVREISGLKSYSINDLRGELELVLESTGASDEAAKEQMDLAISALRRTYRSRLYGVNSPVLSTLIVSVLESEHNQLAIADTENSSNIVSYVASDRRAGEWCKRIRTSSARAEAGTQEEVSALVQKVRNKSGFELALALGDEQYDEARSREYIYGAFANEHGVLSKRFWRQDGENAADFRVRCAKELAWLLYNDRIGDEDYANVKKNARRVKAEPQPQPRRENPVEKRETAPVKPPEELDPEVMARKNRVAPQEDKSVTRTKVIIMLVLVAIVIAVAILVSRGDPSDSAAPNNNVGSGATTTITTTTTTTTLPTCDACGDEISGEVYSYVDADGNEQKLCKQDYDFIVGIGG